VKKKLRDRLSPSMIVALIALVVAMGGTAVAASEVLIDSPDQLGTGVVTAAKIANRNVSGLQIAKDAVSGYRILDHSVGAEDLLHPTLRAQTNPGGGLTAGDATLIERPSLGHYFVTFPDVLQFADDLTHCVSVANVSNFDGPNHQPVMAQVLPQHGTFRVLVETSYLTTHPAGPVGPVGDITARSVDAPFDLVVAC
jgi:hypothetical protein